MKRLFIFIIVILWGYGLQAQERVPFVVEGKAWNFVYTKNKWNAEEGKAENDYTTHYSYYLDGETEIDGQTWTNLYYTYTTSKSISEDVEQGTRLEGAMREADGKVYYYGAASGTSCLLFDFNLSVGESSPSDNNEAVNRALGFDGGAEVFQPNGTLKEKKSVRLSGGLETTLFVFEEREDAWDWAYRTNIWLEGIGGTWGFWPNCLPVTTGFGWSDTYLSCTLNGEVLATSDDFSKLFYGTGVEVPTKSEDATECLFDLQGRRLTQAPAKGVFIQNGKKVTY